ncbi:MAG: hypothetical protein ABF289_16460 [Clostridiales bacterium]
MKSVKSNYIYGTAAKKLEYSDDKKNSNILKSEKRSISNYNKLFGVTVLGFVFILFMVIMQRYAKITEINYLYNTKIEKYNDLKNENEKTVIDSEKDIDLGKIKILAEEMGLQMPENNQRIHIMVPKKDFLKVSEDYKKKQSIIKSSFAALFGIDLE